MYRYKCLNQIAQTGLDQFTRDYVQVEEIEEADALLVRSAALHDMEFPKSLKAIARAGAGVNNIPLGNAQRRELSYSIHPGQMRTASRSWCWPVFCWRPEMSSAA